MNYPEWSLFPRHLSAPNWVDDFTKRVEKNQKIIKLQIILEEWVLIKKEKILFFPVAYLSLLRIHIFKYISS